MRRRKLLIGLGALSAGGSAAFGTEAFTSAQAERNVDVAVAGDRSSFIAIQPLSSDNAGKYVDTESDETVELELDGDNGGPGEGVANDAITQIEDLFRVVNQGSQEVSVYFEDDSDAVTFRVTRSTGTSTTGSNGQSLEGADNSVELAVGEQVVVGMTVDTLNNDVSGQLLDSAVLYADANASAPQQSIPEPQYVVDPTAAGSGGSQPDQDNTHATIASALQAANSDGQSGAGAVIGIRGDAGSSPLTPSSPIDIDLDDVTITGFEGTPTIQTPRSLGGSDNFIEVTGSGVTVRNLEITDDLSARGNEGGSNLVVNGDDATVDGVTIDIADGPIGNPTLAVAGGANPTVTNTEVLGGPITVYGGSGSVTLTGNYVDGAKDEGIWSTVSADLTVENNRVDNHDSNDNGSTEIKLLNPTTVNGESTSVDDNGNNTNATAQIRSLLTENDVSRARVDSEFGTRVTEDSLGSQFDTFQNAVDPTLSNTPNKLVDLTTKLALLEDGTYEVTDRTEIGTDDFSLEGRSGTPTVLHKGGSRTSGGTNDGNIEVTGEDATIENLRVEITGHPDELPAGRAYNGGDNAVFISAEGVTFRDVELFGDFSETGGNHPGLLGITTAGSGDGTVTVEDCLFDQDSPLGDTFAAPRPFADDKSNDGQVDFLNNVFRNGVRLGPNVNSGQTIRIIGNTFQGIDKIGTSDALPGGSSTSGGGTLTIENNNFDYPASGPRIIIGTIPGTVNGISNAQNKASEVEDQLEEDNNADAQVG